MAKKPPQKVKPARTFVPHLDESGWPVYVDIETGRQLSPTSIVVGSLQKGTEQPEAPARTDEEKIEEEMLILRLLAGFHVDKHGREITSYLKPNSFEELKARGVLARQLRDGSLGYLAKELLALAIAPGTTSPMPNWHPTRKIRFESPSRGKPSTLARDMAVVYFIKKFQSKNPSEKITEAIAEAGDHYGIERTRVWEVWTRWTKGLK